jgi:hypothetical protein
MVQLVQFCSVFPGANPRRNDIATEEGKNEWRVMQHVPYGEFTIFLTLRCPVRQWFLTAPANSSKQADQYNERSTGV